jgi:hypothetical protein
MTWLINSLPLSLWNSRKGKGGVDVLEGVESPAAGLVEEGIQGYPAGSGIGGGEGEDILAGSGLSAVVSD